MPTIRIDSILGGHSALANFSVKDQFQSSIGIDPSRGNYVNSTNVSTGLLTPTYVKSVSASTITNVPLWIKTPHPKPNSISYVYDLSGSVYTFSAANFPGIVALNDGGSLSNSSGNGAEYYDNYMYFAKNTTIARYGPLDGSPIFDGDYWVTTLSKPALVNTTSYPTDLFATVSLPNHIMHRHSDGKLYFADVVGNQGTIHVISTTKSTIEGDTDNGSTANKLQFGYGLWPTAIESYGSNLAIALFEGQGNSNVIGQKAKLAFWDTTSGSFNSIIWVEFPDPLITAMKNINGVLYIISGQVKQAGFRVSRYVGGYTVQEVFNTELGQAPFPGAVDGLGTQLLFGSSTGNPSSKSPVYNPGCVFSYGLQKTVFKDKIFNIIRTSPDAASNVYSLGIVDNFGFGNVYPAVGWSVSGGGGTNNNGIDATGGNFGNGSLSNSGSIWWSQVYKIGQPFQIKRIRIPIIYPGDIITPTIYFDNGNQSQTLTAINTTNFSSDNIYSVANIKTAGDGTNIIQGHNNFFLELAWSRGGINGTAIDLPILIDFEIIPD